MDKVISFIWILGSSLIAEASTTTDLVREFNGHYELIECKAGKEDLKDFDRFEISISEKSSLDGKKVSTLFDVRTGNPNIGNQTWEIKKLGKTVNRHVNRDNWGCNSAVERVDFRRGRVVVTTKKKSFFGCFVFQPSKNQNDFYIYEITQEGLRVAKDFRRAYKGHENYSSSQVDCLYQKVPK